jgi:hypothetical protein
MPTIRVRGAQGLNLGRDSTLAPTRANSLCSIAAHLPCIGYKILDKLVSSATDTPAREHQFRHSVLSQVHLAWLRALKRLARVKGVNVSRYTECCRCNAGSGAVAPKERCFGICQAAYACGCMSLNRFGGWLACMPARSPKVSDLGSLTRPLTIDAAEAIMQAERQRAREAWSDGERLGARIVPPVAQPPCAHCWHSPRVWQGPLPVPRHCCWCGVHEGPQHGPYAEGEPWLR